MKIHIPIFFAAYSMGLHVYADDQPENFQWFAHAYKEWARPTFPSAEQACRWAFSQPGNTYEYIGLVDAGPEWPDYVTCAWWPYADAEPGEEEAEAIRRTGNTCPPGSIIAPNKQSCERLQTEDLCSLSVAGNPINFSSGYKTQHEIDFRALKKGGTEEMLPISRYYSSRDGVWRHNFAVTLHSNESQIKISFPDGSIAQFSNDSKFLPVSSTRGSLENDGVSWIYSAPDRPTHIFNTNGSLIKIERGNNYQLIQAIDGLLTIIDSSGRVFKPEEDSTHQIKKLTSHNLTINYTYNKNKQLTKVENTTGDAKTTTNYLYNDRNDSRLLTDIIDGTGDSLGKWTYDSMGRAVSSNSVRGEGRVHIRYDDDNQSVTVTNEAGAESTYKYLYSNNKKLLASIHGESNYCKSSDTYFTYYDNGLLKEKLSTKGVRVLFEYDHLNREIRRKEIGSNGVERATQSDWIGNSTRPRRITTAELVIDYIYDNAGNPLSVTSTPRLLKENK